MLKKMITYTDFDGVERTEPFYFNLTKAELLRMEVNESKISGATIDGDLSNVTETGGLEDKLRGIIAGGSGRKIIALFEEIITMSYGERTEDGRSFIKNDDIRERFVGTEAYSELLFELTTDANSASDFINAILPDMSNLDKPKGVKTAGPTAPVSEPKTSEPIAPQKSSATIDELTPEEIQRIVDARNAQERKGNNLQ